ncbi:MAG TPA: hypothetical protein VFM40_00200, partial [Actinomycetota bacterium]|nr:hypothetical protein [Actinomycetota bacterium]
MFPRILTLMVVAALAVFGLAGTALAASDGSDPEGFMARDEDIGGVLVVEDDDPDDGDDDDTDGNSFTSNVDSNDGTNSRVTSVSHGDDLSRGDLTRDHTKDGPGTSTRDRTANHTNDMSRNDTR